MNIEMWAYSCAFIQMHCFPTLLLPLLLLLLCPHIFSLSTLPHLLHCYNSLWDTWLVFLPLCGVQQISPTEWPVLMIAVMVISLNIRLCWRTDGQKSPAQCCAAEQMWAFGRRTIVVAQFSRSRRSRRFTKRERIFFFHQSRHHFSLANERQNPHTSSSSS